MIGAFPIDALLSILLCPLLGIFLAIVYSIFSSIYVIILNMKALFKTGYDRVFSKEYFRFDENNEKASGSPLIKHSFGCIFFILSSIIISIYFYILSDGLISILVILIALLTGIKFYRVIKPNKRLFMLLFILLRILLFPVHSITRFILSLNDEVKRKKSKKEE